MRWRTPRCRFVSAAGSAICAVAAVACALCWTDIFDAILAKQVELTPTSRSYGIWVEPSVPLYFQVFLFNWTNADKFPGEKPHLVQLGPYSFRERRRNVNISWHAQNHSVSYRTKTTYFFDPATSNGTLQDNITTINAIAASAVYRSRDWGFLRQKGLSMGLAMFGQHVSVSKLARELLFEGYEDPLLDLAKSLPDSTTGGAPPVDRFGWFYKRNNSLDTLGQMEVTTGTERGTFPGQILKWNHLDHLPYYSGECAKLFGTAGQFITRTLTAESRLPVFLAELCRTVNMEYMNSGEIGDLPYHKYAIMQGGFDNSSEYPENVCFCNGACAWSGVMNVSACRYGSPSFVSLPHFLHGDPRLREMVSGMAPDSDKHSFFFAVEPNLGVPLEVAARFQLNLYLEPSPNIALYENVPKMLFPILWVQQHVQIDDAILKDLSYARAFLEWGAPICAGVAAFFALLVAVAVCYPRKQSKPDVKIYEKPMDEAELKLNPTPI